MVQVEIEHPPGRLDMMLSACSILGEYFGVAAVSNSINCPHTEALNLLREAAERGFLIKDEETKQFSFASADILQHYKTLLYCPKQSALLRQVVEWQSRQITLYQQQLGWLREEITFTKQLLQQQAYALTQIMRAPAIQDGHLQEAIRTITRELAMHLQVARVSVWKFVPEQQALVCLNRYEQATDSHNESGYYLLSDLKDYLQILQHEDMIKADDVLSHPAMSPFVTDYFLPNQITSVLDVSFYLGSTWAGVVSLEHQHTPRRWKFEEILFVTSICAVLSMTYYAIESHGKKVLEALHQGLAAQHADLQHQNEQISQSVRAAQMIQSAILPNTRQMQELLGAYFLLYLPKDTVSGDFYWTARIGDQVLLAVADCTGHGVPGAFMSMITATLLSQIIEVKHITCPSEILRQLNEAILISLRQVETGNTDSVEMGIVLRSDTHVAFAGARIALWHAQPDSEIQRTSPDRHALGGPNQTVKSFQVHTVPYQPGCRLYMGSDGLQDQCNPSRQHIGKVRLAKWLGELTRIPFEDQQTWLHNTLDAFAQGTAQRDDILWIGWQL